MIIEDRTLNKNLIHTQENTINTNLKINKNQLIIVNLL